jgi:hypothetical protein
MTNRTRNQFNTILDVFEELAELTHWKKEAMVQDQKVKAVESFIRHHPDCTIGDGVWDKVLEFLEERDDLVDELQSVQDELESETHNARQWKKHADDYGANYIVAAGCTYRAEKQRDYWHAEALRWRDLLDCKTAL